jgi:hypothetical protein
MSDQVEIEEKEDGVHIYVPSNNDVSETKIYNADFFAAVGFDGVRVDIVNEKKGGSSTNEQNEPLTFPYSVFASFMHPSELLEQLPDFLKVGFSSEKPPALVKSPEMLSARDLLYKNIYSKEQEEDQEVDQEEEDQEDQEVDQEEDKKQEEEEDQEEEKEEKEESKGYSLSTSQKWHIFIPNENELLYPKPKDANEYLLQQDRYLEDAIRMQQIERDLSVLLKGTFVVVMGRLLRLGKVEACAFESNCGSSLTDFLESYPLILLPHTRLWKFVQKEKENKSISQQSSLQTSSLQQSSLYPQKSSLQKSSLQQSKSYQNQSSLQQSKSYQNQSSLQQSTLPKSQNVASTIISSLQISELPSNVGRQRTSTD